MTQQPNEIPEDVQAFATRLFQMARDGEATLLDYVDQGVDVNLANQDGNSLLMLSSYSGHLALTEGLIARGADVNALNARGQSPLAGTIFKKEDDIARALINAGADATIGTPSAIDTASMFGREDLIDLLQGTQR
ncbi:ankyrin repeat domain-containing protein [Corynebacterium pseudogenitalium]|uniref:ankyrin repeat domain-containing protein n=1 Tax=Corynebacterium pseudogenitalium TaxID=38303 RepID=UPI00210C5A96|nr:ankyrin repeat domain-containing protein [Corynebacterium pseudogenitalium]MCQ4607415.1 ankyrin repeat domain-containing protein [Corynebacterium pseudogenitalium]